MGYAACGLRLAACGLRFAACGLRLAACGILPWIPDKKEGQSISSGFFIFLRLLQVL